MIDRSSLEGHRIMSVEDGDDTSMSSSSRVPRRVKCECGAQFESRKKWAEHLVDKKDE